MIAALAYPMVVAGVGYCAWRTSRASGGLMAVVWGVSVLLAAVMATGVLLVMEERLAQGCGGSPWLRWVAGSTTVTLGALEAGLAVAALLHSQQVRLGGLLQVLLFFALALSLGAFTLVQGVRLVAARPAITASEPPRGTRRALRAVAGRRPPPPRSTLPGP